MNSPLVLPGSVPLTRQDIVTALQAVNNRKRTHDSDGNSSSAIQPAPHDKSLSVHRAVTRSSNGLPIKQRIISPLADSMAAGQAQEDHDNPAPTFVFTPESRQKATADTTLLETIDYFPADMQGRLLAFRQDEDIKTILTNASVFIETLKMRDIELTLRRTAPYKSVLFSSLARYNLEAEHRLISDFFRKATLFFAAVDTKKIKHTSCLSSMLASKRSVLEFINMRDEDIQHTAALPHLNRQATLNGGKSLPNHNSVLEAAEAVDSDLEATLSVFCLAHQSYLRENHTEERNKTLLNDCATLIDTLRQRDIRLTPRRRSVLSALLFEIISPLDITKDYRIVLSFIGKATVFFQAVDSKRIKNTDCLSTMLKHRLHIEMFTVMDDSDIEMVASHPFLLDLAELQNSRGLPDPHRIKGITSRKDIKQLKTDLHTVQKSSVFQAIIDKFVPEHQTALQQHQHASAIVTLLNNAKKLLDTLKESNFVLSLNRRTPRSLSIFSTLANCRVIDDYHLMTNFFHMAEVFFATVDRSKLLSTGSFTCMIKRKKHIRSLMEISDDRMREFARNPCVQRLCTMNSNKGLPDPSQAKSFTELEQVWSHQQMSSVISKICAGQKMPDPAVVLDFIHQLQGLDPKLIDTISSICRGCCIPDTKLLDDFLTLQELEQSEKIFDTLANVCQARGLPPAAGVRDFLQWLPEGQTTYYLNLLKKLYSRAGIPDSFKLNKMTQELADIFHQCRPSQPEDNLSTNDQLKLLALFCLNPDKWRLNAQTFKNFLCATHFQSRHSALATMQEILLRQGGAGLCLWLAKYDHNQDMDAVTKALLAPASLNVIDFALSQLDAPEWLNYIELCKNLSPKPSREQWESLTKLTKNVDIDFQVSTTQKRVLLEVLWCQHDFWTYITQLNRLFKTVPTVSQLHRLFRLNNRRWMNTFLDACLAWRPTKKNPPKLNTIETLLDGLLLVHYPIDCPGAIPDHCFSKISASERRKSVIIDGDAVMTGNERLWHFVVTMLVEINRIGYDFNGLILSVKNQYGRTLKVPKPKFSLTNTGFLINNWSISHLEKFFWATDFVHYNEHPDICKTLASEHMKKATEEEKNEATIPEQWLDKTAATLRHNPSLPADTQNSEPVDVCRSATSLSAEINRAIISGQPLAGPASEATAVGDDARETSGSLTEELPELPDFSWLLKELDYPEDQVHMTSDDMSVEKMLAILDPSPDSP